MSAAETLRAAQAAGVRVGVDGTDLLIEADRVPAQELLNALRRDKPEILALLHPLETDDEIRSVVITQALNLHALTSAELQEAAGEDWLEVCENPDILQSLAQAVVTRRQRERGECPPHWMERSECASCGPVYLWSGIPSRVRSCPWCFNRVEGRPIPRPVAVNCATCRHFRRVDPPSLGHCAAGEPELIAGLRDTEHRVCAHWLPLRQSAGAQPNDH